MYLFTIFLLGTIIQDSGKKDKSDDVCQNLVQWLYPLFLYSKFQIVHMTSIVTFI